MRHRQLNSLRRKTYSISIRIPSLKMIETYFQGKNINTLNNFYYYCWKTKTHHLADRKNHLTDLAPMTPQETER